MYYLIKVIFWIVTFIIINATCNIAQIPAGQDNKHSCQKLHKLDYQKLIETGVWHIVKHDSSLSSGHITLKKHIWAMHFLHWWPMSEENKYISVEYAKEKMMSLWGDMPFVITGIEGKTSVSGHDAYYTEGNLGDFVRTQFIVWNCHKSGRQFISDCNINKALNTPDSLLQLQIEGITNTICCHDMCKAKNHTGLKQYVNYKQENISFYLPDNWRSHRFIINPESDKNEPGYYPDGMSEKRGTIWNLLTDSEKEINFIWKKNNNTLTTNDFEESLNTFFNDTIVKTYDTLTYNYFNLNVKTENIQGYEDFFEADGSYNTVTSIVDYSPVDTSRYIFKAFMWKNVNIEYLLLVSMVAHSNFWGIPLDLKPTDNQFKSFYINDVLNNITNHPIPLNNK